MARTFNGSGDRIDFANSLDWNELACSFSFWCYPADIGAGQAYQYFLNKGDSAENFGILIGTNSSANGELRFLAIGVTELFRDSDPILTQDVWQHVCVTWDGVITTGSSVHMYIDGIEPTYKTTQNGATATACTGQLTLGGRINDDARNYEGQLAELARWDRVITAGEISGLAAGYTPKNYVNGLTNYIPVVRGAADEVLRSTVTFDGTTVSAHSRVIQPSAQIYQFPDRYCTVAGDATASINESDMVTGGKKVTLTLNNNQWVTG